MGIEIKNGSKGSISVGRSGCDASGNVSRDNDDRNRSCDITSSWCLTVSNERLG